MHEKPNSDELLTRLYGALAAREASRPPTAREMPPEAKREYDREAKRRSRERAKQAAVTGALEDRADVVRDVLADAALILLATGAPGADAVERLLGVAFRARPGVPGKVRARARSGALRPKLLTPDVLRAATPR